MIRVDPTVSTLNTREYFSTKETKTASKGLVISSGACCYGCVVDLPAFANPTNPTDRLTNDRTDFIYNVGKGKTVTGTLTKIEPDATETEYIITDNTYGLFFPTSTLKQFFWGFILDWYKVYNTLGFGRYKFNVTVENAASNVVLSEDSPCFRLLPYTCDNAHRTVKISTKQRGYFEGGLDYTNLFYDLEGKTATFWPQEIRLWGRFYRNNRRLTVDNIVSKDRGQEQVQTQSVRLFNLLLDTIQPNISDRVLDDLLQAPEVYINDYNYNNETVGENERVTLTNFNEPIITTLSKDEYYTIELEEYFQNNVHRYR